MPHLTGVGVRLLPPLYGGVPALDGYFHGVMISMMGISMAGGNIRGVKGRGERFPSNESP